MSDDLPDELDETTVDIPRELAGALQETGVPHAVLAVMLELSQLRSAYVVGKALHDRFPTEDAWVAGMNDRATIELVDEFADFLASLRTAIEFGEHLDPEGVQRAVNLHYEKALRAVGDFSEFLGVDGPEVLSVLVNTPGRLER